MLFRPQLWNVLFVVYLLIILTGLSIPTQEKIDLTRYIFGIRTDHYIHALLFTPFMICQYFRKKLQFKKALFQGYVFAICCEFLHYFIPYRSFDTWDIFANVIGMTVGALFFLLATKANRI